jgi:hypothetical protein
MGVFYFPVEIHWDVLAPRPGAPWRLNPAPMWDRAWNGTFGRATARLLAPEDQLLYLAWHHFIHGLAGLLNLCDTAEVVRQYGTALDWERLLRQAEQGHTTLLLAYMLWWTATYLDAPVPEAVWAQQRGRVQRIHRWHIGLDRSPLPSAHLLLNPLAHLLRQRPFFPHPLAFARFAAAALFPSAASFARFHPTTESPQRYAYYLFRLTRLRNALRYLGQIMGW